MEIVDKNIFEIMALPNMGSESCVLLTLYDS